MTQQIYSLPEARLQQLTEIPNPTGLEMELGVLRYVMEQHLKRTPKARGDFVAVAPDDTASGRRHQGRRKVSHCIVFHGGLGCTQCG